MTEPMIDRGYLIALVLVAGCGKAPAVMRDTTAVARDPNRVKVDSAQRERFKIERVDSVRFTPIISTTGTVAFSADHSTQVLAPMSGPVTRILVNPGASVHPGEALAAVSSPDFASAVSAYRKADAVWQNAKKIADLDEQLFKNDALARRELDQARTDLAGAGADKESAMLQLTALGVDQATITAVEQGKVAGPIEAMIRAPIAGTLVEKLITPGQLLQAGTTPCFTIADLSSVWVMANVFEADIRSVHQGDVALVTTEASSDTLPGVVDYVAALVDPNTRATAVRLVVPNRYELLKRDMLVQVLLHSKTSRKGLVVPVSAVLRDDENLPFLYVAMPDGSFARRRIDLGGRLANGYAITSGLAAGERIVVDGSLYLSTLGEQ